MFVDGKQASWSKSGFFLFLACVSGMMTAIASAQDCRISVQTWPQVLYGGQSTSVDVLAHPSTSSASNRTYAFASATFDVYATAPAWTYSSAGTIVGNDVLGIHASRPHLPRRRIFADPSNPISLWRGILQPQSQAPALITIEADSSEFSVYPNRLKPSSVQCDAEGGSDYVFVNPLPVGGWLAAPAAGTEIQTGSDDVIVDGRIITGGFIDSVAVGIIPTGNVRFFSSSTGVSFDKPPSSFTATVQVLGSPRCGINNRGHLITGIDDVKMSAQRSRVGSMTLTFNGMQTGGYAGHANFMFLDGSVRHAPFNGFLGGVYVASGDLGDDDDGQIPGLLISSLPQTIESHANTGALRNVAGSNTWVLCYAQPVVAVVRGADGLPLTVTLDRIEVSEDPSAQWARSTNNLKQISLGCHVFEAVGVQAMRITPSQGT